MWFFKSKAEREKERELNRQATEMALSDIKEAADRMIQQIHQEGEETRKRLLEQAAREKEETEATLRAMDEADRKRRAESMEKMYRDFPELRRKE